MNRRQEERQYTRFSPETLVSLRSGVRISDATFDFASERTSANGCESRFRFRPESLGKWERIGRELAVLRGNPMEPSTIATGAVSLGRAAKGVTIVAMLSMLKVCRDWANGTGRGLPRTWTQADCDAFIDDLRQGTRPRGTTLRNRTYSPTPIAPATLTRYVNLLRLLYRYDSVLTDGGLSFDPWRGVKTRMISRDAPQQWCVSEISPPGQLLPLLRAAETYVATLSVDIIPAWRYARTLAEYRKAGPGRPAATTGRAAREVLAEWLTDPGNRVLVHHPESRIVLNGTVRAFEPNWNVLEAEVGAACRRPGAAPFDDTVAGDVYGAVRRGAIRFGLVDATARVEGGDEVWCEALTPEVVAFETYMLRSACYVLGAALTGARDSELQDWQRGCLGTAYGAPAIKSTLHKHASGEAAWWWVSDEVVRAYQVLEEISTHETHLFAPLKPSGKPGLSHAREGITAFIDHINRRAGQLNLIPIPTVPKVNQRVLRHTLARVGALTSGGEMAFALQFKHARAATTASYMAVRPDDPWLHEARDADIGATAEILEELAKDLSHPNLAGPAAAGLAGSLTEYQALVVSDDRAAGQFLRQAAANYHLGAFNDCVYDEEKALCRKDLPKGSTAPPGPLISACHNCRCENAVVTPRHAAVWVSDKGSSAAALRTRGLSSARREALKERIRQADRVLGELGDESV